MVNLWKPVEKRNICLTITQIRSQVNFGNNLREAKPKKSKILFCFTIWSDDRYGFKDFLSTIPTPTHGLKVKVTDLEVYS